MSEPKHQIEEGPSPVRDDGVRIRHMLVGQIAQITQSVYTTGARDTSTESCEGAYIMRGVDGVVFLSLPRRGWASPEQIKRLEHRIRILPRGASLTLTVGV